jgi:DNA-binding NarL/FixJ family response regulator
VLAELAAAGLEVPDEALIDVPRETEALPPRAQAHTPVRSIVPEFDVDPSELTDREVEVLALLAEGLTDVQIAERLVLSARTVQAHLRSIYSKLGVTTRTAAARYALTHGLS